jgi:hypothetical protein
VPTDGDMVNGLASHSAGKATKNGPTLGEFFDTVAAVVTS